MVRTMVVALVLGTLGACAVAPGEQVANRIRAAQSQIVREVIYRPANALDPAEIVVYLRPGTSEAEARRFWCDTVVPAGGSESEGETGVSIWNDAGSAMMALDVSCPP
jgi:hypothetical protein